MTRLLSTLVILSILAAPSWAGTCGPRDVIRARLATHYNEVVVWVGLVGKEGKAVGQMWQSAAGTWTWTVTYPNGVMCLVASGYRSAMTGDMPKEGEPM